MALAVILGVTAIAVWAVATDRVSYVVTHGVSMNPVYYQGDLVFVVKADSYHIGDIAAYHSTVTGETLHRIIGGDATTGYVFKGDNNQSTDIDNPKPEALIGRAVLHVPKGGIWLKPVLSPTGLGMMGFLIVGSGAALPRNRREVPRGRRKKKVKAMARQGGPWATAMTIVQAVNRMQPLQRGAAAAFAVLALLGVTLGVFGWMKAPVEVRKATSQGESLVFSYSTTVPRSAAYDGVVATSPDPIFRKLAKRVDIRMRYQGSRGTFAVTATLTNNSGWHTTMQLLRPTVLTDSGYDGTVPLDLDAIDARGKAAATAIGIDPTETTISVDVRVDHGGEAFTASLPMILSVVSLNLTGGPNSLTVKDSEHPKNITVIRRIGFLTASAARGWAVLLLISAAAGAAVLVLAARRASSVRTRADIERRYPQLLVHVEPLPSPPGKPVVNVDNFGALAKLAERYGQMILTWRRPDADDFVVRDEGITYRYRIQLDEPPLQNVELIDRPAGAGTHRRKASSSQVS